MLPTWLPLKEQEEIVLKRERHYYAGFEADQSVDCLLSWRFEYKENHNTYVIAGLPVRQTFPMLPKVGDVLKFIPTMTTNYGTGETVSLLPCSAKVISLTESNSSRFDYNLILEFIYDSYDSESLGAAVA